MFCILCVNCIYIYDIYLYMFGILCVCVCVCALNRTTINFWKMSGHQWRSMRSTILKHLLHDAYLTNASFRMHRPRALPAAAAHAFSRPSCPQTVTIFVIVTVPETQRNAQSSQTLLCVNALDGRIRSRSLPLSCVLFVYSFCKSTALCPFLLSRRPWSGIWKRTSAVQNLEVL